MKPWEIIKQLEADNSRIYKENVLKTVLQTDVDHNFWEGAKWAYNPRITFYVKKVPTHPGPDGDGLTQDMFWFYAGAMANRSLSGQAAQDAIAEMMMEATVEQWDDWYRRILIKDLRCGVTETTINKIRPDTIPIFSCQLAKDAEDNPNYMTGKKIVDYKLDGVRVLAIVKPNESVTLHSRNGKQFANFPHIEQQLKSFNSDIDWILDGEITSSTFQTLMTQVNRKTNVNAVDAVFNIFDAMPLSEFDMGKSLLGQRDRSIRLKDMATTHLATLPNVNVLDYTEVDLSTPEGYKQLVSLRNSAAVLGYEGVMVKDADALYECKRSTAWMKIKPTITVDLTVDYLEEGTGKYEGMLGALGCSGEDHGKEITVSVGSGLSDDQRKEFWANAKTVVGSTVEIKADAITQNRDGTYSLRFPRFERFRGFTPGEKI